MSKTILITGASEGIGAATAIAASKQGYTVCLNYRNNKEGAEEVKNKILSLRGQAYIFKADVSIEDQVAKMFRDIDQQVGTITSLVNNAGIIESQMQFVNMPLARIKKIFDINVLGTMICTQEAIKRMSTKTNGQGGSIVNVSSMSAKLGSPHEYIDYAASKGAVDTFTIGLAKEIAIENIRVNGIRPGIIDTAIHAKGGEAGRPERLQSHIPLQRPGTAEEVANAIMWLLSDEASYVTGTIIDVSGGR
jgi:NAD(P)-dependent dehydrogenase (short-subunit alcohol dehydrogenase family)